MPHLLLLCASAPPGTNGWALPFMAGRVVSANLQPRCSARHARYGRPHAERCNRAGNRLTIGAC